MIQPQIDLLLGHFGKDVNEIVQAKQEYYARTGGEVHEDDRCYEQRTQAFFNWFLFDRRKGDSTLVERFLRERGAELPGRDKEVLMGCTQSRLSLYEFRGQGSLFSRAGKGQVAIRDVITGVKYNVNERRHMHGLEVGDLFEARLVPVERQWHFSSSFNYLPREVTETIEREIKRRKKAGTLDARELVWDLERMTLQHERFKNVAIENIFNFKTPFLSKRPKDGEAESRE